MGRVLGHGMFTGLSFSDGHMLRGESPAEKAMRRGRNRKSYGILSLGSLLIAFSQMVPA
jgi:hypothetical protein